MESLADETWDLVIAGTGLVQALLALSLSRSDLKILHVDENLYYGGDDAGLSLDESIAWVERHELEKGSFSVARASQPQSSSAKLAASRAYTLSLNPQIVYAQSKFLPSLVSSTINSQLEFLAVGAWWIYNDGKLQKIPSSREDVFADSSLSRRDKIGLMKFLRHVVQDHNEEMDSQEDPLTGSLSTALTSKFKILPDLQLPILALGLSQQPVHDAQVETTVARIKRHMLSMGYFGPGFGAVLAKYAGNAEVAQVSCRACAVGGATYLLGQGVSEVTAGDGEQTVDVTLTNGVTVKTKYLVSSVSDLPRQGLDQVQPVIPSSTQACRSISIVSSPLKHLLPPTSENGPNPAAAVILVNNTEDVGEALRQPPIYLQVHSEDTGIIYGSTTQSDGANALATQERLASAVQTFLHAASSSDSETAAETATYSPEVLWSMTYMCKTAPQPQSSASEITIPPFLHDPSGRVLVFPPQSQDIAFDDNILDSVKTVWTKILGDKAEGVEFLRFEDRAAEGEA